MAKCAFLAGDWLDMVKQESGKEGYDVVLMSEVIYSQENYDKVIQVILGMLKQSGVAIMGTKMYYFGVGGSLCEFEEYLENTYGDRLVLSSL